MNKKKFEITPDNPVMNFIGTEKKTQQSMSEGQGVPKDKPAPARLPSKRQTPPPPEGYKINPVYIETKTKRVQFVFKPSLLERAKARAAGQGISLNEFIHRVLEKELSED